VVRFQARASFRPQSRRLPTGTTERHAEHPLARSPPRWNQPPPRFGNRVAACDSSQHKNRVRFQAPLTFEQPFPSCNPTSRRPRGSFERRRFSHGKTIFQDDPVRRRQELLAYTGRQFYIRDKLTNFTPLLRGRSRLPGTERHAPPT